MHYELRLWLSGSHKLWVLRWLLVGQIFKMYSDVTRRSICRVANLGIHGIHHFGGTSIIWRNDMSDILQPCMNITHKQQTCV